MYHPAVETKMLISFAVTVKLICVFVFACAKSRFSHDRAHMCFFKSSETSLNEVYFFLQI